MPEAVDSNSIFAPEIQPARQINSLYDLSNGLKTCKIMLANVPETGSGFKTASAGISVMLDYLSEGLERLIHEEETTAHQHSKRAKLLRNEFIAEKLRQGFSARQISQALNMRITVIERIITKLHGISDNAESAG